MNCIFFSILWSQLVKNSDITMQMLLRENSKAHYFVTQNKIIYYIEIGAGVLSYLGQRYRTVILHLPNFGVQCYLIYFTFANIKHVYSVQPLKELGNLPSIMMAMLWIRIIPYLLFLLACCVGCLAVIFKSIK